MNRFLFHTALKYRISRHILFFVLVVLIFTLILYSRESSPVFYQLLYLTSTNAFIFMGYAYLTIFVLIPAFLPERQYWQFGLLLIISGLLLSALKLSLSDYIFYSSVSPEFIDSKGEMNVRYILINAKDMSFIVALLTLVKFTKDWLIADHQHIQLQKRYAELNLRLLQSHFEPHFLFNTLNNLYALSLRNQEQALDVIRKFKRLLQFSIDDARLKKVELIKEVTLIKDYIQIEQIRYGSRLQIKENLVVPEENLMIAPFVLFTLVENCFKHGSSTDAGMPWIELTLQGGKNRIIFSTKNSTPQKYQVLSVFQEKGLLRLRQRLDLIYPKKYKLILKEEPNEFEVKLILELN